MMNFTEEELYAIKMLIELKIEKLQEAESLWEEFGDPIPDFIEADLDLFQESLEKIEKFIDSLNKVR